MNVKEWSVRPSNPSRDGNGSGISGGGDTPWVVVVGDVGGCMVVLVMVVVAGGR